MRRLIIFTFLFVSCTAWAASQKLYDLPDARQLKPDDRMYIYQNASGSRNLTGAGLQSVIQQEITNSLTSPRISDNLPTQFDVVMLAGVDYSLELIHTDALGSPIDLTGSVFYAQFRSAPAPTGTVFANFSTPIVSAIAGTSKVTLSKAQTQRLSGSTGLWDLLQVHSSGSKYRMSGRAKVQPVTTVLP